MKPIRYYIGLALYKANERKEEKYWDDREKYFSYLGSDLFSYFWDVSSKYAFSKKNDNLFQWHFWIKFYSMYIPEKIYRLFCDLFKLNY